VHQCVKVPFFHELSAPFFILQVYDEILCLNAVSMCLTKLMKLATPVVSFNRIDLSQIIFSKSAPFHMYVIHDQSVQVYKFKI